MKIRLIAICSLFMFLMACGATSGSQDTPAAEDTVSEEPVEGVVEPVEAAIDTLMEVFPVEAEGQEIIEIIEVVDVITAEEIFEIVQGGFLWPCADGTECDSGLCVEYMGTKVCTVMCENECLSGWTCTEIQSGEEKAKICLSPNAFLCRPCLTGDNCVTPQGAQSFCVKYPENSAFCGTFCNVAEDCPEGYGCISSQSVEGNTVKVCRRNEGLCPCTSLYDGMTSRCENGNDFGVCAGARTCAGGNWGECAGEVPFEETCDGLDNDCDDKTDEDLENCCICGNKTCETFCGEDVKTCAVDCVVCGNGKCEPGEGPVACPQDCCGECGDKICANYPNCTENADNCALDCGLTACGNSICEKGENPTNCPADCGKYACGNGACEPGEDVNSCPVDCGAYCGNCECEGGEDFQTCPVDCGYCGDGYCSPCPSLNENLTTCFKDCCKGEEEKCDGVDNDCDGYIDEEDGIGCEKYYFDYDGDGYGLDSNSKCFCAGIGYYKTKNKGDCNDFDATINPSVENNGIEKCDGKDNDCDGKTDEGNADKDGDKIADCVDTDLDGDGSVNWQDNCPEDANSDQKDMDNDGVGDVCDPDRDGDGKKNEEDNCPDKYNPLQQNIDKDSKGDACDEDMDEDGKLNENDNCPKVANEDQKDSDLDNVGDACDEDMDGDGVLDFQDNCPEEFNPDQGDFDKDLKGDACDMDADGDNYDKTVDCNDLNMNVKPGALEFCNSIDDDCDETVDDSAVDCIKFYKDEDNDNYGAVKDYKCLCGTAEPYDVTNNLDCDDTKEEVNPKADEECDGYDNDCDGQIDEEGAEGCSPWYFDYDDDGYGVEANFKCLCGKNIFYRAQEKGDCNDYDPALNPGNVHGDDPETCDGKDNDCDGEKDEGNSDLDNDKTADCVDQDVDGDGIPNEPDNCPYTSNSDQKDTDDDGIGDACAEDKDGDGILEDGDGSGEKGDAPCTGGEVTDCDDNCPDKYNPLQEDMDGDKKGDACDDDIDGDGILNAEDNCPKVPNAPVYPETEQADKDGDNIGDACDKDRDGDGVLNENDNCPDTYNPTQGDIDQNGTGDACDEDADGDGYEPPADCDDLNPNIRPNAVEVCNNLDDNCDNMIDNEAVDCVSFFADADEDMYGAIGDFQCLCKPSGVYKVTNNLDCDDTKKAVNPQADETCDKADNDCDGLVDEENAAECDEWYFDYDGDGAGVPGNKKCLCGKTGYYRAGIGDDCNDYDSSVNPGNETGEDEAEWLCNGKDDDCDNEIDEGYPDSDNDKTADCVDQDVDGDGIPNGADNCPFTSNKDQKDTDNDGTGDACATDKDGDGIGDDGDGSGTPGDNPCTEGEKTDCDDNCPDKYNPKQEDMDGDKKGDVCDDDIDGDGILNADDNCPKIANAPEPPETEQADMDADGTGDVCDQDRDGDGVVNTADNCPDDNNPQQGNMDSDDFGDVCDNDADGDNESPPVDCNDLNKYINTKGTEFCNNIDDDCDGTVDNDAVNCMVLYQDADEDKFGSMNDFMCLCNPANGYTVTNNLDCDDTKSAVNPKTKETCDTIDNDCDGIIDEENAENCKEYSFDLDSDGWGLISAKKCLCQISGYYRAENHGDCNDNDDSVNPSMETGADQIEIECNGKDDDCDGSTDEMHPDLDNDTIADCVDQDVDGDGVSNFFDNCPYTVNPDQKDTDGDGEGDACENDLDGDGIADESDNCVKAYNPQQEDMDDDEKGDACDDDIDGDEILNEDDNCPKVPNAPVYPETEQDDMDGDGIGDVCDNDKDGDGIVNVADNCPDKSNSSQSNIDGDSFGDACDEDADNDKYKSVTSGGSDCNDLNAAVHPDAIEVCNGIDDDCDTNVDTDAINCLVFYKDTDGDKYGDPADSLCLCNPAAPYDVTNNMDCDDTKALVNPKGTEECDTFDNDCDGLVDEENAAKCSTYYFDYDSDTYGLLANSKCLCAASGYYKGTLPGDCNDLDASVNPGKETSPKEWDCNGRDDDCDGSTDEGYDDLDNDGVKDCVDTDWDGDGVANFTDNCKYTSNPDQKDTDGDGIGDACETDIDGDKVADSGDNCPNIYNPLQENMDGDTKGDACDDDIDGDGVLNGADNCPKNANGANEPDPQADMDGDGIGDVCDNDRDGDGIPNTSDNCPDNSNSSQSNIDGDSAGDACDGDADDDGFLPAGTPADCNDLNAAVNPDATEVCNGIDDDCDGTADTGAANCTVYYKDGDSDGYGKTADSQCRCSPSSPYTVTNNLDCDDSKSAVNPNAAEACDSIDNDCDGSIDEEGATSCITYYFDYDKDNYGLLANSKCLCAISGFYRAANSGDCNDNDDTVNPGKVHGSNPETCNGRDDDCDGQTDEGNTDLDNDGTKDCVDTDRDGDGVNNSADNCPDNANSAQTDIDADGIGDICDTDKDGDGVLNSADNCPEKANSGQGDMDSDTIGDACDPDRDGDQINNTIDNCPDVKNADQANMDGDSYGDLCDPDRDGDGIVNDSDNCPDILNSSQSNIDGDAFGDACDDDADNDTYKSIAAGGTDCNDLNASVHPGAAEICNGLDDDCDSTIDVNATNCTIYYKDGDGDDYGNASDFKCLCSPAAPYDVTNNLDCDDSKSAVNPNATEACDTIDNDCDGTVDEENASSCATWYFDYDKDNYGLLANSKCLCSASGFYRAENSGDCNDNDGTVNPGMENSGTETCNGRDDDCDGNTDEGNTDLDNDGTKDCVDTDKDGDGVNNSADNCPDNANSTQTDIDADGIGDACDTDKDGDGILNSSDNCPEKANSGQGDMDSDGIGDVCDPDRDDDGINNTNDNCPDVKNANQANMDGDSYGDLCDPDRDGDGIVNDSDNCPDISNSSQSNIDGDSSGDACDGDADNDGYVPSGTPADCNDLNPNVHPGAVEICNNLDDDCDSGIDVNAADCTTYYKDGDSDNFGKAGDFQCLCKTSGAYKVTNSLDCDDTKAAVNPNAVEACDTIDNDCDGSIDEEGATSCITYYFDYDKDNYGLLANSKCLCAISGFYRGAFSGDCNDNDDTVNPGVTHGSNPETCNGRDDDCDNTTDEGNTDLDNDGTKDCVDTDRDGDGVNNSADNCPDNSNASQTDTDDDGYGDVCDTDDDGDGVLDSSDNCSLKYNPGQGDMDSDGIGDVCDNDRDGDGKNNNVDNCPDDINPGQEDQDGDGIGNICDQDRDGDGIVNGSDNCPDLSNGTQSDIDGDSYGDACDSDADGDGVTPPTDCNDLNKNIKPDAPEICNGLDDNCDGGVDVNSVNCVIYYRDHDHDNYGTPADSSCICSPAGEYTSLNPSDCNDNSSVINPQATEKCDNIDNNCNGFTDEAYPLKNSPCDGADIDLCTEGTWVCNALQNGLDCSDVTGDSVELCNGIDDDCDGNIPANEDDKDYDGFRVCQSDCNDLNINIYPGAPDDCQDSLDNNCDNANGKDKDHDGYGSGIGCTDCDDNDPTINPDALDFVDPGDVDSNCDGIDGLDSDNDGYPAIENPAGSGEEDPNGTDCDDDDGNVNPGIYDWKFGQCENWAGWTMDRVGSTGQVGEYSSMKVDSGGKVHAVFYDRTYKKLKYATNATGSWVLSDIDSFVGTWTSMHGTSIAMVDGDSTVHVAYNPVSGLWSDDQRIRYAKKVSGSWQIQIVDTINVTANPSIAVGSDGFVHIAYYLRYRYDESGYRLAYSSNKSGFWKTQIIDNSAGRLDEASRTAIELDSNKNTHIAYYACGVIDSLTGKCSRGDLGYATNSSGIWRVITADTINDTGLNPSIALGANNSMHISYHEADNGDLKHAMVAKTLAVTTETVDATGDMGEYSAVMLDQNNHVMIAYYDRTMDKIKVAKHLEGTWQTEVVYEVHSSAREGDVLGMDISPNRTLYVGSWDELNGDYIVSKSICEVATNTDANCDGQDGMDLDGDGHVSEDSGGNDCNDNNENVYAGYLNDTVNGIDNDCDGVDGVDSDGDGYASIASGGNDCNDNTASKNPGMFDYKDGTCDEKHFEFTGLRENDTGMFPSFALDSAGKAHVAFTNQDISILYYMTDRTGSWVVSALDTANSSTSISLAVDANDNVFIAYQAKTAQPWIRALRCYSNTGGTWHTEIAESGDTTTGWQSSITADAYGSVYISYTSGGDAGGTVRFATNSKGAWQATAVASDVNLRDTSIAVDSGRTAHIVYSRKDTGLYYMTNRYGYWQAPVKLTSGTLKTQQRSLTVDTKDIVHIAYYNDTALQLQYATNRGGTWTITAVDSSLDSKAGDILSAITADSSGYIHIIYNSMSPGKNLKYATNKSGSWVNSVINSELYWGSLTADTDGTGNIHFAGYNSYSHRMIFGEEICDHAASGGNVNCDTGSIDGMDSDNDGVISIASGGTDCNDMDAGIKPGAADSWGSGGDTNCDGIDGIDADGDGFAANASGSSQDCNDSSIAYNPSAADMVGSGVCTEWKNLWDEDVIDTAGDVGRFVTIAADTANAAHLAYRDITNYRVKYATNESGNWLTYTVSVGGYDSEGIGIAVDSSRKKHLVYDNDIDGSFKIYYATRNTGAWNITQIDTADAFDPAIAVDTAGKAHISYMKNNSIKYATNTSGSWQLSVVFAALGYKSAIAVDAGSKAHIVNAINGDGVRYMTNASGSWTVTLIASSTKASAPSIAVTGAGVPHVAYALNTGYYYATKVSGSWNMTTLDTSTASQPSTAIALDSAGKVHISYYKGSEAYIQYINNTSGSWSGSRLAESGMTGKYLAMAIGPQDKIHVGFYNERSKDLGYITRTCSVLTQFNENCDKFSGLDIDGIDADGDGFASVASGGTDCNDANAGIKPVASDTAGNSIDENCDGVDGMDNDRDGFASTVSGGTDCIDTDPAIYSGATDIVGSGSCTTPAAWSSSSLMGFYSAPSKISVTLYSGNKWRAVGRSTGGFLSYKAQIGTYQLIGSSGDAEDAQVSIALDTGNKVHISYRQGGLQYATNSAGTWAVTSIEAGNVALYSSIEVDSSNQIYIAYSQYSPDLLKLAGKPASTWNISTIDSGNILALSTAVDRSNKLHIAYSGLYEGLKYVTNATGSWKSQILVSDANPSNTSIAADFSGKLHISFYGTSQILTYLTNISGTWKSSELDISQGTPGQYNSIIADRSGRAHISYYDPFLKRIRYATNQSGSWLYETVATPSSGYYSGITYGTDNRVYMMFWEDGDAVYKFKNCTTFLTKDENCDGLDGVDSDHDGYASTESGGTDCDDTSTRFNPASYDYIGSGMCAAWNSWTNDSPDTDQNAGRKSFIHGDHAGSYAVAYSGKPVSSNRPLLFYSQSTGIQTIESNTATYGVNSPIRLDTGGKAHIVYQGTASYSLKYATNQSGSWPIATLASDRYAGYDMNLDSNNKVHIAYSATSSNWLKYGSNVGAGWVFLVVDSSGTTNNPSIAVNFPDLHITYERAGLKYAKSVSGSWTFEMVDSDINSVYPSIVLDKTGKAHIAYISASAPVSLKYATNMNGSWVLATIDSESCSSRYAPTIDIDIHRRLHIVSSKNYCEESPSSIIYSTNTSGSWTIQTLVISDLAYNHASLWYDNFDNRVHVSYPGVSSSYVLMHGQIECTNPVPQDENCDGLDGTDADRDGFVSVATGGNDCDDTNSGIYPLAGEYVDKGNCIDSKDNDCDSKTDAADIGCSMPLELVTDSGWGACFDNTAPITCPSSGQDFYGQDGTYMSPANGSPPAMNFYDNGDGTINDNVTGLIWMKCSAGQNWTGSCSGSAITQSQGGANSWCLSSSFLGKSWRLPTRRELIMIHNYGLASPALDSKFTYYSSQPFYWTATEVAGLSGYHWTVYSGTGKTVTAPDSSNYSTRCVSGTVMPSQNLSDNADGTVTDTSVNLMWQKTFTQLLSWKDALNYCENLTLAGYTDWKLPEVKELSFLMCDWCSGSRLNTNWFSNDTNKTQFQSSSTSFSDLSKRWVVNFEPESGETLNDASASPKTFQAAVGCVRTSP